MFFEIWKWGGLKINLYFLNALKYKKKASKDL